MSLPLCHFPDPALSDSDDDGGDDGGGDDGDGDDDDFQECGDVLADCFGEDEAVAMKDHQVFSW